MKFKDDEHKVFYEKKLLEHKKNGSYIDCYIKSVFYLLGLSYETREHFSELFDMKKRCIKPEGLDTGWQTGTSIKICRLAFNLWNGLNNDSVDEYRENHVQCEYAVDNIFCCNYMEYFFEAIRIRFEDLY